MRDNMFHSISVHHVNDIMVSREKVQGCNGDFEVIKIYVRDNNENTTEVILFTNKINTPITF